MVFSSLQFVFIFLPVFLLIYYLVPAHYRNAVLFLGSMVFYTVGAWHEPVYIVMFLFSILVNYLSAILIERSGHPKLFLTLGLVYDFGWLFVFKYADFFMRGINSIIGARGGDPLEALGLILPIGISFYTFQAVSYLVDVYRKDCMAELSFIDYGAYLSMFPQLIAGPIVKYTTVAERLSDRNPSFNDFVEGLKTFIFGLGLKVLLANRLGSLWSSVGEVGYDFVSTPLAWLGILSYTFQLYFDFFGYSQMAIGLGRMLGFDFPKNFNNPYISRSMTEFWRRWHMTLSGWFRDYVYIPLGGNRRGTKRTYLNLFIVWFLTGLWHGASVNFIIWGLATFALIAVEKAGFKDVLDRHPVLSHIWMIFVIQIMWALFAVTDMHDLGMFLTRLIPIFGSHGAKLFTTDFVPYLKRFWYLLIIGGIFSTELPYKLYNKIKDNVFGWIFLLAVFWGSIYCIYRGLNDPFLYFRF